MRNRRGGRVNLGVFYLLCSATNDGGVVHDKQLRDFAALHSDPIAPSLCTAGRDGQDCGQTDQSRGAYQQSSNLPESFVLTCYNPALGSGLHGIQILQQLTPYRRSMVRVR
jgi:hypothetical protein